MRTLISNIQQLLQTESTHQSTQTRPRNAAAANARKCLRSGRK